MDFRIRYTGAGTDIKLQGVVAENFSCSTTASSGTLLTPPIVLSPSLVNINCRRKDAASVSRGGTTYSKFERGVITIQTAEQNLQLYFPEQWDPYLPEAEAARLRTEVQGLKTAIGGLFATGTIMSYVGKQLPTGWAWCDGKVVMRAGEFGPLFAIIGETYGRGNGSTSFQLPNFNSRFLQGTNDPGMVGKDEVPTPSGSVNVSPDSRKGSDSEMG